MSLLREPAGSSGGAGWEGGQLPLRRDMRPGTPEYVAPGEGSFTFGASSLCNGQEEPMSAGAPAAEDDLACDTNVQGDGRSAAYVLLFLFDYPC